MPEKIITLEEHFLASAYSEYYRKNSGEIYSLFAKPRARELGDLNEIRLRDMDDTGIDLQIVSNIGAGFPSLTLADEAKLAREANDQLAEAIRAHPERLAGFASLPMTDPVMATLELQRSVKELGMKGAMIFGTQGGKFMDDPSFFPILERAAELGVPLYLHPATPPPEVQRIYYSGFLPAVSAVFASAGWGWHQEVGIHVLRLILAGALDRLPSLQIIIGHMGEMIPFMLDRTNRILTPAAKNLEKSLKDYLLANVYLTTSGFFSEPVLELALKTFGADRVMFSVDYPFESNKAGVDFLNGISTISREDKEKIAYLNAEKVFKL